MSVFKVYHDTAMKPIVDRAVRMALANQQEAICDLLVIGWLDPDGYYDEAYDDVCSDSNTHESTAVRILADLLDIDYEDEGELVDHPDLQNAQNDLLDRGYVRVDWEGVIGPIFPTRKQVLWLIAAIHYNEGDPYIRTDEVIGYLEGICGIAERVEIASTPA